MSTLVAPRWWLRTAFACLGAWACLGLARANDLGARMDRLVRAEMARMHIPGLGLAVVRGDRVVALRGYGLANLEHRVPATPLTMFQSASVGKQFAAALVLLLARDGRIDIDAPVTQVLPDAPAAWSGITARQLMNHTAGLERVDPAIDLQKDYTDEQLLRSAYLVPLRTAPGQAWHYSDLGYQVLGHIASRIGGRHYGDQLRDRLFRPAGMEARIISERDLVPHRAAGYDREDGVMKNQRWVAPTQNTTADGSLYLSARDLARWFVALDGDRPLDARLKPIMWTPARLNGGTSVEYGLGWKLGTLGPYDAVMHDGEWQGFTSHVLRLQQQRLAVVVLANRSGASFQRLAEAVAALYLPAPENSARRRAVPVQATSALLQDSRP